MLCLAAQCSKLGDDPGLTLHGNNAIRHDMINKYEHFESECLQLVFFPPFPVWDIFMIHGVNFQVRLEVENEATAVQPGHIHHRHNRDRHHRRGHNHHHPAASYPLPASTHQSQPQNLQQTQVQPASTESAGQREAMTQLQTLLSDRPAQTQSNSVSSQELSVQSTPSISAAERDAIAPL
ncbi:hypothetical protein PoB_007334300 [Plakobranchus ocellatus]|uniref:Uncharacterized protein n=1 Tax=Plakobranchus ocellatus TaxID=259542 RepID=A0AAV4DRW8_9GAST|nr:hypothetical protein PoB_007334300 [Plakobranchus ocellatus]